MSLLISSEPPMKVTEGEGGEEGEKENQAAKV
jgi:hypothetical protein